MKIKLTEYDLKTLKQDNKGLWSYSIKTKYGNVVGSEIKSSEDATRHAEKNLINIVKSLLTK